MTPARGQAMTELLITASFVLIPLLLLIPLLGKYIDIQHAAIQAARYEAWEQTVWYADSSETPTGFNGDQPLKTEQQTQRESRKRFFTRTDMPIDSAADAGGYNASLDTERNQLWKDHRGTPLWNGAVINNTEPVSSDSTPDLTGGVMNALLDVIDTVFEAMGEVINAVATFLGGGGAASFDVIDTDGFARSNVQIPVAVPAGIIDVRTLQGTTGSGVTDIQSLTFSARAAVLTEAWNAGGISHVQDRSGGIVPTRLLDDLMDAIPGFPEVRNIIGFLIPEIMDCDPQWPHFLDENQDGWLWLGYVNADAVPPDRLDVGGDTTCENGLCAFTTEIERAPCGGVAP